VMCRVKAKLRRALRGCDGRHMRIGGKR